MKLIWIGIFGAAGVLSRYGIAQVGVTHFPNFPAGTLLINVLGALLAGAVAGCATQSWLQNPELKTAILAGFLGGFTTFSAYCLDAYDLWQRQGAWKATLYFVGSPLLGGLACGLGLWVCKLLPR